MELHVIAGGSHTVNLLSSDLEQGAPSPLSQRERGKPHASPPEQNGRYAAALCRRGFDFADFEIPPRDALLPAHPEHTAIISALTRD